MVYTWNVRCIITSVSGVCVGCVCLLAVFVCWLCLSVGCVCMLAVFVCWLCYYSLVLLYTTNNRVCKYVYSMLYYTYIV